MAVYRLRLARKAPPRESRWLDCKGGVRPGCVLATPPKTIRARSASAEDATMQTIRPPTHWHRPSPPQPVALEWPATDYEDAVHDLFFSISVPPEQFYDSGARLASGRLEAELMHAVLADALGCVQKGVIRQGRRVQRFSGTEFALHHIANAPALSQ